ncbi:hypothetical protein FD01_GL000356 [Lacticaseibacillus manihotivorans DSM 13343 = JCM 12514]|uniref:N-acetyltransferase domain-containing protein n=3 Tax=Lacticaseibacillus manihotivorans TaxID=88233 RepID=A0A0R1R1G5_9LACO|nr:hypothetical protein FD01_GL000356 [Lacticaseibacillus manihotivorans DSM 13343 = JCM 12514]QFQ90499.1 GNAT family N-acetyltransferase [Lacticaseibacillus manihotivorans]
MITTLTEVSAQQLDDIMAIWLASNLEAHSFVPARYWQENFAMVKQLMPQAELTVAQVEGKIVGFAGMQDNYLAGIFIDSTYRDRGLGTQLLTQLQSRHPVITLNVFDQNRRAKQFYQRHGFHLTQKQFDEELGVWDWTMTNSPVIYQTERLVVRQLNQSDRSNLARTLQDAQAMYAYAHAFSDDEVDAWLNNQLRRYREDGFGLWAVETKAGEFIGQCGLTIQRWQNQDVVEIGYLLQRDYWHQGYASEAAQGAKRYAFNHLLIPEVWSIIRDNNCASMNVAIRNGMLVRGKIVKHYYDIDMPHFGFSIRR